VILPKNTIWSFNHFYSKHWERNIKWNVPFQFHLTWLFGTCFEGGQLWSVRLSRSVGPKCPFPFEKIVVPSTALLYPAYNNNNQTRGGLGRVFVTGMYRSIGHVEFRKFQSGVFVEWKARIVYQMSTTFLFIFWCCWKGFELISDHFHMLMFLLF